MVKANNRQTTGSIFASRLEGREFGKYRAEKLISRHEFRQTLTLLAINMETKERVALKAFGSFSAKSQKEFEKERAAFKKLENRHGVLLPLETFEYEGDYFIVTEYKSGGDLRGWLETKPKVNEILDVFARIAESIDYVHENKIIHRDIKPENVVYEVLDEKVAPYLMDFGISVTLSGATLSFETEHTFGTVEYMAPELFSTRDKKTKAVDIYAFGLMLYEALEGRHPLLGNTQQETISQILSGDVPLPEKTVKRLGENAGSVLVKALSKNPDNRPETATEIVTQVGSQYRKYVGKTYGKYITEEYLGQGLYGVTCKAYELKKNKKVIIKLLTASQPQKPDIGDLRRIEQNKGIVPIIDSGCENGMPYLVSEYLAGDNLRHFFSPQGMEIQDILKILKPLSAALEYLHRKNIIHCYLKPENILLQKNRIDGGLQPFVNDYGVSRIVEAADILSAKGNIPFGNLDYLAPELLEGGEPSPATDVYSLGVIIYEAIEGKTPFDTKSLPALIKQKWDGNVPVPGHLLKGGGIRATRVLLKALNVKPEKRQSSISEMVSQFEDAVKNRGFADKEAFIGPWVRSRKLISDFRKKNYVPLLSVVFLFFVSLGIFSLLPGIGAQPTVTAIASIDTPVATLTSTPTLAASVTPTPLPIVPAPTFVLSDACKLPAVGSDQDYPVPSHLLLQDVYRKKFNTEPDSNDLYAIAYFNNRKILEGYKYHFIDPISLDVRRDWKIFIPPLAWIEKYKKFPATIPQPVQVENPSKLHISGSSILSHLSAQISKCAKEITGIELVQSDAGNTTSGLRDLCQSKVDLFGANKEIDPRSSCVELEKFEVAKYVMVIFVNKNNPHADDIQKNPLTIEELANLLTGASKWKDVRIYWTGDETITRYYPPLESGEFEIVKDGIFPDRIVLDAGELNIYDDGQLLIDMVAKDVNAIGMVDYASFQNYENKNQLTVLPVNGVYASSVVTDNASTYPLMTTLYLYTGKHAYETNETLRNFINYYLSHELDFLDDLGYLYPSKNGYTGNRDTVP